MCFKQVFIYFLSHLLSWRWVRISCSHEIYVFSKSDNLNVFHLADGKNSISTKFLRSVWNCTDPKVGRAKSLGHVHSRGRGFVTHLYDIIYGLRSQTLVPTTVRVPAMRKKIKKIKILKLRFGWIRPLILADEPYAKNRDTWQKIIFRFFGLFRIKKCSM